MIALVILGLGLLFIAALLPVGVEYSRQTNDQQQAQAAVEYAFEMIEHYVRTSDKFAAIDPTPIGSPPVPLHMRVDSLFRPREAIAGPPPNLAFAQDAEPRIKVRPLIGMNVDLTPGVGRWSQIADQGEGTLISGRLGTIPGAMFTLFGVTAAEYPSNLDPTLFPDTLTAGASLFENPVLPCVARVYPPVTADSPLTPLDFLNSLPLQPIRRVLDSVNAPVGYETRKAADRRLAWLAFYRRASNDRVADAPQAVGAPALVSRGDPLLYEFIVVVVRRTSANHRFPVQNITNPANANNFANPAAAVGLQSDRLIPEPWMICLDPNTMTPVEVACPPPSGAVGYYTDHCRGPVQDNQGKLGERFLTTDFKHPARLSFRVNTSVARLLPAGSILIPAVNDYDIRIGSQPMTYPLGREVGFVPSDPDALPVYKVLERLEDNSGATIVVEGNGSYPWYKPNQFPPLSAGATRFVCWVVPPSFVERDGSGQPVFERRSPIVTVARRTVRVPEVVAP